MQESGDVRTVGVDLAAQPEKTAMCAIEWTERSAYVEAPVIGVTDKEVLAATAEATVTGIDAPFGWPRAFLEAISTYAREARWPAHVTGNELRHRLADRVVIDVIAQTRKYRSSRCRLPRIALPAAPGDAQRCSLRTLKTRPGRLTAPERSPRRPELPPWWWRSTRQAR